MKILITGGTGFIGSNLCENLLKKGNEVICLDNNFTGNLCNVEKFRKNQNFMYIYHDILNPIEIEGEIDEIYHLACPASPPKYQIDPIYTSKVCYIGTLNVLNFAKRKNAKVLFSSTSEIYGEPEISPQNEKYRGNVNTLGIRSCYDEGKRIAETLMMDFNRKYNVKTRIVRIFNTYGKNMDKTDGRVVSNFINQALKNEDITIYGNGTQTRSFCYIDDLICGMIKVMKSDYTLPINIGNTHEITIKEFAKKVIQLTKSKSKIINLPLPEDDPTNRKPDIEIAKKLLKWEPVVYLENGLEKTIEYFRAF
jgi:UDP-glucuronate decarboxylase